MIVFACKSLFKKDTRCSGVARTTVQDYIERSNDVLRVKLFGTQSNFSHGTHCPYKKLFFWSGIGN